MSMTPGSVTVDGAGNESGTGYAFLLYQAQRAYFESIVTQTTAQRNAARQQMAAWVNAFAPVAISYVAANARCTITIAAGSLGAGIPASDTIVTGTVA